MLNYRHTNKGVNMKATIEQVSNGFLVTTEDGQVFVATRIDSYSYTGFTVAEILKNVFEPKVTELKEAA